MRLVTYGFAVFKTCIITVNLKTKLMRDVILCTAIIISFVCSFCLCVCLCVCVYRHFSGVCERKSYELFFLILHQC